MQMICGGVILLVLALGGGEAAGWAAALRAPASWLATLYLALFGSVLAFSAYLYLQRHTAPALATSNAYVNPLVALALGAWLRGERLDARIAAGAALVVLAVALAAWDSTRRRR